MRATNSLARWGLAACLVGGSMGLLQAQDTGFSHDFKLRLSYAPAPKDKLAHSYQGFGWNLNYGLGVGKVGLELGYMYLTGDPYITSPDTSRMPALDTSTTPATGYAPIEKSVEDKRNELSGFAVRLSWSQKLTENWDWQAGIAIGPKYKHQYVAHVKASAVEVRDPETDEVTESLRAWEETYNGTPTKGGFSNLSLFGGVSWKVDEDSSLELNLTLLRYDSIDYHHYAGTGTYFDGGDQPNLNDNSVPWRYDRLDKHSRMVPHFEIAYVFHF